MRLPNEACPASCIRAGRRAGPRTLNHTTYMVHHETYTATQARVRDVHHVPQQPGGPRDVVPQTYRVRGVLQK